jgi:hypothetical protein
MKHVFGDRVRGKIEVRGSRVESFTGKVDLHLHFSIFILHFFSVIAIAIAIANFYCLLPTGLTYCPTPSPVMGTNKTGMIPV